MRLAVGAWADEPQLTARLHVSAILRLVDEARVELQHVVARAAHGRGSRLSAKVEALGDHGSLLFERPVGESVRTQGLGAADSLARIDARVHAQREDTDRLMLECSEQLGRSVQLTRHERLHAGQRGPDGLEGEGGVLRVVELRQSGE